MKIYVDTYIGGGKSGTEARAPQLHLTAHGITDYEALASLERGILAWCISLESVGELERALRQKHMKWETDGEQIIVELNHV